MSPPPRSPTPATIALAAGGTGGHLFPAEALARAGADSVGLSDSVGVANPVQVRRMFKRLRTLLGDKAGGAHLHNTRGQGLANAVAAIEAGATAAIQPGGSLRDDEVIEVANAHNIAMVFTGSRHFRH